MRIALVSNLLFDVLLIVLCLIMELGIVWLIGAMLFRLVGLCLLGLKLFSVRRLSIELSCVGTVLTYAGILVLHDDFVGDILLVVLSFVVECCLVWLIGAMLVRTLMFDSLLFELTFVG